MQSIIGKLSVICLATACLSSVYAAEADSFPRRPSVNAVAMEANGIPTSIYNLITGDTLIPAGVLVPVVNQITFPTVFVGPVFEGWFSTVRICADGVAILGFSLAPSISAQINIVNDAGTTVKTLTTSIVMNGCVTYNSEVDADPLFSGVPLGLYKVTVTNTLSTITQLGSLDGVVNSTGRDVVSRPLSTFLEKAKKAQAVEGIN